MPYNKEELFNLPVEEKLELVEALWDKIDDELLPVSEEEIKFARERLNLHNQNPSEGLEWSEFKLKIKRSMAFKIIIKPIVFLDLDEALMWYESEQSGLAQRFYKSFLV